MVIADWMREKLVTPLQEKRREEGRAKGREEGRAEGRVIGRAEGIAEVNARWRAWLRRLRDAEARGEPFDEPEPYSDTP